MADQKLWVPPTALEGRTVFACRVCGREFPEYQRVAYTEHVIRCGEEHHDALVALGAGLREWNREPDPEWGQYNRALEHRGIDPEKQFDPKLKKSARRLRES